MGGTIALIIALVIIAIFLIFMLPGLTGAPYVPTLKKNLNAAFKKLYPMKKTDLLIDLGAGDGVVLKAAASTGAKAIGVEINPILTLIMKIRFCHNKRVSVKCRNFYKYRFPKETTVVYAFAVSLHINKIYQKISDEATRLNKTIYFISNAFDPKDKKPEKQFDSFYLYKIEPKK